MESKIQSPFAGKPVTTETKDEQGRSTYSVELSALTPLRARVADWLSGIASFAVGIGALRLIFMLHVSNTPQILALLVAPLPAYWIARYALYRGMQKTVHVMFTPEHFTIRRMLGNKTFDRNLPHSFALYVHDRAGREEEVLSYKESKLKNSWWPWALKRYLGRSYHLSFDYLDQRNEIMTVYRRKHAHAMLARLNAVRRVMDNEAGFGSGQALAPERDWTAQPGELAGSF